MPVASAPAAFSVIEKQMRLSPLSRGLRNFSFWYSVPWARIVIIEASSGPCVFIESAPSELSPSSICTSALASGPRPIPPYSLGTNGHHSPCARAFFRSLPSTSSSGLVSSSFSAGMHSSCTHLRTFSRIALASAGTSKSIDMGASSLWFLMVGLAGWHIAGTGQRQRQTKFEATAVIPRACGGIQYAAPSMIGGDVGVYWSIRWSLSSGSPKARPVTDDDMGARDARSRRPVSRLFLALDQHQIRAHLRPRRRQRAAAVIAAWIFRNACYVAPRRAAAR